MYVSILIIHTYHKIHTVYSVLNFHKCYFCKVSHAVFSLFQNYFTSLFLEVYILQAVSYCCIAIYSMYPLYIAFRSLHWLDFYMFHITAIPNNYIINMLTQITWRKYKNIYLVCLQKLLSYIIDQIPFQLLSLLLFHCKPRSHILFSRIPCNKT